MMPYELPKLKGHPRTRGYTIAIGGSGDPEFPIALSFTYDNMGDEDPYLLTANPDEVVEAIAGYIRKHNQADMQPDNFPEAITPANTVLMDDLNLGLNLPAIFRDYMHIVRREVGEQLQVAMVPQRLEIQRPLAVVQRMPPPLRIPLPPLEEKPAERKKHAGQHMINEKEDERLKA